MIAVALFGFGLSLLCVAGCCVEALLVRAGLVEDERLVSRGSR